MVNIEATKSNWRARGFSCDVWTDSPGQTWEDYTHAVDELVMVLEGDVEFEIGGRNVRKTTSRWLYGYKLNEP